MKRRTEREDCEHILFAFVSVCVAGKYLNTPYWSSMADDAIDDLHISHNASGMGANIRVLLIRNSSSHSSLDVNGLELPCLAATLCVTRLSSQG